MEEPARTLPDDVVLEVLARLDDIPTLFRFATAAKRWCGLITDRSFLRRRWPENLTHPSFLVGFFTQRLCHGSEGKDCVPDRDSPPVFVPSPRSVLGPGLRSLPSGLLNGATPLTARRGLLLVGLAPELSGSPIRLAVCDLLAGTCDVLPPLHRDPKWTPSSYAILTGQDYHSADTHKPQAATPNYSRFFKVLAIGFIGNHPYLGDDVEYSLSLFSSAEPGWVTTAKRLGDDSRRSKSKCYPYLCHDPAVCRHGMAHWLCGSMWVPLDDSPPKYFTMGVRPEDGHVSVAKLCFPEKQPTAAPGIYQLATVDGALTLFLLYMETEDLWLHTWTCRDGTHWHNTMVTELKPPEHRRIEHLSYFWPGEKSGTLFIIDSNTYKYIVYLDTGAMEEVSSQFRDMVRNDAVPMEIDWPDLFLSRLRRCLH